MLPGRATCWPLTMKYEPASKFRRSAGLTVWPPMLRTGLAICFGSGSSTTARTLIFGENLFEISGGRASPADVVGDWARSHATIAIAPTPAMACAAITRRSSGRYPRSGLRRGPRCPGNQPRSLGLQLRPARQLGRRTPFLAANPGSAPTSTSAAAPPASSHRTAASSAPSPPARDKTWTSRWIESCPARSQTIR